MCGLVLLEVAAASNRPEPVGVAWRIRQMAPFLVRKNVWREWKGNGPRCERLRAGLPSGEVRKTIVRIAQTSNLVLH